MPRLKLLFLQETALRLTLMPTKTNRSISSKANSSFWLRGRNFVAAAGSLVHAPKRIQHGYRNSSAKPAKILVWAIPAGLENFFLEVGDPASDATPPQPNFERILAIAPKYGLTIG